MSRLGQKAGGRQRRGWPESRGLWRRTREKSATPFLPPRHYRKARGEFREWLKQEIAKAAEDHGLPNPNNVRTPTIKNGVSLIRIVAALF